MTCCSFFHSVFCRQKNSGWCLRPAFFSSHNKQRHFCAFPTIKVQDQFSGLFYVDNWIIVLSKVNKVLYLFLVWWLVLWHQTVFFWQYVCWFESCVLYLANSAPVMKLIFFISVNRPLRCGQSWSVCAAWCSDQLIQFSHSVLEPWAAPLERFVRYCSEFTCHKSFHYFHFYNKYNRFFMWPCSQLWCF